MKFPFLILIIITLFSCNINKSPEKDKEISFRKDNSEKSCPATVLGIQLGKPIDEQLEKVFKENKLAIYGKEKCINYGPHFNNLLGKILYDKYTKDGVDYLLRLRLSFINPALSSESIEDVDMYDVLSQQDVEVIIKMIEEKYGKGEEQIPSQKMVYSQTSWTKGDMIILFVLYREYSSSKKHGYIEYRYKPEIEERIVNETSKDKI